MSTYVLSSTFNIHSKSKSSLHGLTSSDFSPTADTWQWLLSFQHFKFTFRILGFFSKTGKTRVSHRVKLMTRWPGRERWPIVTRWPNDPVPCLVRMRCPTAPELSTGPFYVTRFNPTHQLTDPTQPNPTDKKWNKLDSTRPDPVQLTNLTAWRNQILSKRALNALT